MRAGSMNRRCTFLKPVPSTDGAGNTSYTWAKHSSTWASFWHTTAVENRIGDQNRGSMIAEMRIRLEAAKGVDSTFRVLIGGKTYEIQGMFDIKDGGSPQCRLFVRELTLATSASGG